MQINFFVKYSTYSIKYNVYVVAERKRCLCEELRLKINNNNNNNNNSQYKYFFYYINNT